MSMFRNWLLEKKFWASPRSGSDATGRPTVYIKHVEAIGGIYAYLENRGVKIVINRNETFFNNFTKLDSFYDRLGKQARSPNHEMSAFNQVLNRRTTSNVLRNANQFERLPL